jgi:Sulfotransferase family
MGLLFIMGTGRCGSTMVHELLSRHPRCGFISNFDTNMPFVNSKGKWNNTLYRWTPRDVSQRDRRYARPFRVGARFGPSEPYRMLARRVSPMLAESFRDVTAEDVTPWLEHRSRLFFEERVSAQGKDVFLCKLSGWPRVGFIHEIFPEAKFLHIVRDGRAVADSLVRRPWWRGYLGTAHWQYGCLPDDYEQEWQATGRSFVALAGIQWKLVIDAYERARRLIPPGLWMDIRYEDLVAAPRVRMEEVLAFAGLEWTHGFERPFARYHFMEGRSRAYRDNLTRPQIDLLEGILSAHLRRLGYDVTEPD